MRRCLRHMLLVVLLQVCTMCMAQEDEYVADTLAAPVPPPPIQQANPGFSTIIPLAPVTVRKVSAEKIDELKRDDAYWYANLEPQKKQKQQTQSQPSSSKRFLDAAWFRNLLWVIILCSFIGVVIWYLASSNINLFQRKDKFIGDEVADDEIPEDIFSIHYEKEIQKAVDNKNYRLATRLWYLRTLKELSDRDIIDFGHDKTDSDYVNSLYGSRYYHDFFRLTRNFEYTWYGQFPISPETYNLVQADFSKFKNSLS